MSTYTVARGGMTMPQALAAAAKTPERDTIHVYGKIAPQVIKTDGIDLIGHGAEVDASGRTYGLVFEGSWGSVTGFDIHGSKNAGIVVKGHHINVTGNEVHHGAGSGIVVMQTDFSIIKGNYVHDLNGAKVVAGITVWQPTEIGYPGRWAHIQVVDNEIARIHQGGKEGFTVLLDNNPKVEYDHRALVQGNHGSDSDKGMMAFRMDDFLFRGNHSEDAEWGGAFRFRDSTGLVERNTAVGPEGYVEVEWNHITYRANEHVYEDRAPQEMPAPDEHVQAAALHINDWIL